MPKGSGCSSQFNRMAHAPVVARRKAKRYLPDTKNGTAQGKTLFAPRRHCHQRKNGAARMPAAQNQHIPTEPQLMLLGWLSMRCFGSGHFCGERRGYGRWQNLHGYVFAQKPQTVFTFFAVCVFIYVFMDENSGMVFFEIRHPQPGLILLWRHQYGFRKTGIRAAAVQAVGNASHLITRPLFAHLPTHSFAHLKIVSSNKPKPPLP